MNETKYRWIIGVVAILSIAALTLSTISLFFRLPYLQQICHSIKCEETGQLSQNLTEVFQSVGVSLPFYSQFTFWLDLITLVTFVMIAALIMVKKPRSFMAIYTSLVLIFLGTSFTIGTLATIGPFWEIPVKLHQLIAWLLFIPFFYLFPNGKFTPKWTIYFAILWVVTEIPYTLFPNSFLSSRTWPEWLSALFFFGIWLSCIVALIYRYRKIASEKEKQQIKWLIFGLIVVVGSIFINGLVDILPTNDVFKTAFFFITKVFQAIAFCFIPLSIGYAILKHQMWQIEWIFSRTLLFTLLTTIIIVVHVLVVGGLGALFQSFGNIFISLLSTGIIALSYQPLTVHLQRLVNRIIYGERDEPLVILTRLAERLEGTLQIQEVLPTILETTVKALKLPYVKVMLKNGSSHEIGTFTGDYLSFRLIHQGDEVGSLLVGLRTPKESFSKKDVKVLSHLAKQISTAAHSVIINTELQKSREKLVTAREEERRRLRRDLHDGIGPSLAAQTIKVGVARQLLAAENTTAADRLLETLENDLSGTLTDIRHIIYNLRPPSLDDLGLVGAIREFVSQLKRPQFGNGQEFQIEVNVPHTIPSLPAAVEVALFRIFQEGLTNVIRHSGASKCLILLQVTKNGICLMVEDNGSGIDEMAKKGVGLLSMKERATEIGGYCHVQSQPRQGTKIEVFLPLMEVKDGSDKSINRR
jgi:signal transduction histidine kinase